MAFWTSGFMSGVQEEEEIEESERGGGARGLDHPGRHVIKPTGACFIFGRNWDGEAFIS